MIGAMVWMRASDCFSELRGLIATGRAPLRTLIIIAAICLLTATGSGRAAANETLTDFISAQGCAIGPATLVRAAEAGHGHDAIDALIKQADATDETIRTGDWIVLPSSICRIQPPDVHSKIQITDPEVAALTSDIDGYAKLGDRGCFLDGPGLMERVQVTRGWDRNRANLEYMRFLAENLRTGDLAFYTNDPLSTPPGFQILRGDCADVPEIDAIRQSQALRDREFDALIREDAANVICGRDDSPSYRFMDLVMRRTRGENTNAWMVFEVKIMTIGGGWYVGNSATQKGTPRPPLCRFQ